jgi:hypothetical protein
MGDLLKAKGWPGVDVQRARVEVTGKDVPSAATVEAINAVLRTVNPDIEVKQAHRRRHRSRSQPSR